MASTAAPRMCAVAHSVASKASSCRPLAESAMARTAQPAARVAAAMAWLVTVVGADAFAPSRKTVVGNAPVGLPAAVVFMVMQRLPTHAQTHARGTS